MDKRHLSKSIKERAQGIGFDLVGISPVDSFPENQFYKEWLARGFAGEMKWMERNPERREDVKNVVPGAKSVISCGINYNTDYPYSTQETDSRKGWISRYAWGENYHDVIEEKLSNLLHFIKEEVSEQLNFRFYVDTGPVLERVYGKYAGIGWIGKNTCLINQDIGSWIFLGEIITNVELEYDNPVPDRCGSCTKCIDACPTDAIREPYVLDSTRCISYFTIELREGIPREFRDKIENNVFGCDICQDICPWNRKAEVSDDSTFKPREGAYNPDLASLSQLSPEEFREIFRKSPVKRAKRKGFLRNVVVAMGNSEDEEFIPYLEECLKDEEPMVRAHAAWALHKIEGRSSTRKLLRHLVTETHASVREEIATILKEE